MRLILCFFAALVCRADTELLSDLQGTQLVGINDHNTVVGQACFDGCGISLWIDGNSVPSPDYLMLPFATDTVPLNLNNADQALVWSSPYAWGGPGDLLLATYSIFSLTAPPNTNACAWGNNGFEGELGQWCGLSDGFIEPVQIEDGYTASSDFSLWQGIGLHSINAQGTSIVPCAGDCYDAANNSFIAGYIRPDPPATAWSETPEPNTLALLLGTFSLLSGCRYYSRPNRRH